MSDPDEFHRAPEPPNKPPNVKFHRQYSLKDGEVISHIVEQHVVDTAMKEAISMFKSGAYSRRTCAGLACWKTNPTHANFLEDRSDNYLFLCFGCIRWFYNGLDMVGDDK